MKRVRVVVTGRVQGVFFRASCAAAARRLALGGWVRNLPDGRVAAAFEGLDAHVDQMVEWCRRGPEMAGVDAVEVTSEPLAGEGEFLVTG
ncbi:MAG: acylphosphatase [Gaiellaceae bacterium]